MDRSANGLNVKFFKILRISLRWSIRNAVDEKACLFLNILLRSSGSFSVPNRQLRNNNSNYVRNNPLDLRATNGLNV